MNPKVRIIKHKVQRPKEPELDQLEQPSRQSTREITTTIKLWVSEFKERRRTDEQHSRNAGKLILTALSLWFVLILGGWTESKGQQLRDAFRRVEKAVVVIRTEEKELAPFPQGGMVSANGLGSGVLISNDGKILTAAHLVEAANAIVVEFSDGELIPARVSGAVRNADVALLQLEHAPARIVFAPLGDSGVADYS